MRLKLRQLRRARDITQQELARKINVGQNTISVWEHSQRMPPLDKCLAMASVLGVSIFDLIEPDAAEEHDVEGKKRGRIRYPAQELEAWMRQEGIRHTTGEGP